MKHARSIYLFTAFISGMSVMAVEMSVTRLLSPYFGTSIFVWTNLIGLVMIALAIGYYMGGKLADRRPNDQTYFSLILFTAVWVLLMPFGSRLIIEFVLELFPDLALRLLLGSFISVFILLVVPMIMLGMIVPYTVKLVTPKLKELGQDAGRVSAVSTLGSILGTFLPSFVLLPLVGATKSFVILGSLLLFVAAIGLRRWWVYFFAILSLGLMWLVPPVFAMSNMIHSEDSPYQYIFVTENEEGRRQLFLENNFGMQSDYLPDRPLVTGYYSFYSILPAMIEDPQKVLILGHAGGTYTRIFNHYYPDLEITGVELDPAVTRVAEDFFDMDKAQVEIFHGDARAFLETTDEIYDIILVDAYHLLAIPPHLATQEFYRLVGERLTEDGVVGVNVVSWESEFLDIMQNTLSSVFTDVRRLRITTNVNTMLLAKKQEGFSVAEVHEDLDQFRRYFMGTGPSVTFDPEVPFFTDDKSALVELKTQAMMMDLYSKR